MHKEGKSWKQRYISILENGPSGKDDYVLAKELIDAGYARGKADISNMPDSFGEVSGLTWLGANTQGRMFADTLREQIESAKLSHKLRTALLALLSMIVGALITVIVERLTSA